MIGSVISGTLRYEETIPAFIDALAQFDEGAARRFRSEYEAIDSDDADACHDTIELSQEIEDALNENAPDYTYFGTHQGDGADFGFWVDWDRIQEDQGRELYHTDDSAKLASPDNCFRVGLVVNDHGNASLFRWDDDNNEWTEVWSVV